ncbi:MAG TPA: S8 family serine peptidase, partial [Thermoanaerobaculia bacterium]|nr:S8 family serine peptidase [Thermoanaerobaculia bacterium]
MPLRKYILVLFVLLIALPLCAATARPGWSKVELSASGTTSAAAISSLLQPFGGEVLADYGSYTIAYLPSDSVEALTTAAGKQSIRVRTRDDLDVLELPGADLDAREGISGVAPSRLFQQYTPQQSGLFVLQFVAPARTEWVAEVQSIGWKISRYIPNNAYLIIGPPELAAQTRALGYVQWLDFFHPYQKSATLAIDGAAHDLLFELPAGAASESAVEAIRAAADGDIEVNRGSLDTLVYAHMSVAAANALLSNPMILSVGPRPDSQLADARQVQSLTSLLNAGQTQPLPNQDYWNWVLGRCTECASMPASIWRIGAADSGLDNGSAQFGHPDLDGRKYFGILGYGSNRPADTECSAGQLLCDAYRHGTLVSGIAVGNATTGARDSGGYFMGLGGAPTAGIFMTKILTKTTGINPNFFFDWTADAANNSVTIQNHSWEDSTPTNAGFYTALSRMFDIAARDADDAGPNRIPLLMTVAAGNDDNGTGMKTSPVGMAKNVLSVGGLENYRPEADANNCRGTKGDSFFNIMRTSRNGTKLTGYIKPDVMAPASLIVSTQTSIWWPDPTHPYCLTAYEGDIRYSGDSGTSFAAPLGAAASMIVKRYLGTDPANTSPALVRAVLVAGARSVRGGEDRSKNPAIPISAVPSQQQGFGRLTLEDILNGAQKPVVFDQSPGRTFTQAGQTFCTRLRIRDASKPVKIALVWTDTPATAGVSNPLVNDLNLEVRRTSTSGQVYVGNSLAVTANGEESVGQPAGGALPYDSVNNIEYFRSFMNANEEFNITVKAQNIAGDTDGNLANFEQDFALAILNADVVSVGSCDTPPTASFFVSCVDLTCTANGSASSDDFGIINYGYNWGDGVFTNGG